MQEFLDTVVSIWENSGFFGLFSDFVNEGWKYLVMLAVACLLLYLAIVREFEPLLLLPIGFGMLLANLPFGGMIHMEYFIYDPANFHLLEEAGIATAGLTADSFPLFGEVLHSGGLADMLYLGIKLGIYPPLIFLGIGTMTDFGPLIANPKSLLLGAAAQLGIFIAFIGARLTIFSGPEAASIGIIGGADGPTAIWLTSQLAPQLLGSIAVAAYSYMALVPVIQPPIMKLLTTKPERNIVMKQLRTVSRTEKILFPVIVTLVTCLILPPATPLLGMLMLGNLMRESGVVERINKTAGNELMNIITIFLGVSVGATTKGDTFITLQTIIIIVMGLVAFAFGTAGGVLLAKLMNVFSKEKVNPLIGSAGVSAVPMAARVSQKVGQAENPQNFLLMHAMGPNVAGVIGSAVAAGILLNIFGG